MDNRFVSDIAEGEERPYFSVVIPLYNKENNIIDTVHSVLNQTYPYFEIVVVDDGSTDNSLGVVSSIIDKRLRIITQENAGVSKARNTGIINSKYDWIALLDGDDLWMPDYLKEMAGMIHHFPDAKLIGCSYYTQFNGERKQVNLPLSIQFRGYLSDYFHIARQHPLFWSSAVCLEKNAAIKVGLFDEQLTIGEDLDLWYRMNIEYKTAFFNQPYAVYNYDGVNRAMHKKHPISKSIYGHLDKYDALCAENPDAADFINYTKIRNLPANLYYYNLSNAEIQTYINDIGTHSLSPLQVIYLRFPNKMKIWMSYVYYGHLKRITK